MTGDQTDFDFSYEELFEAFRLVLSDADARRDADALRAALEPGMDWATSEEMLLLLSIATASGRAKVDRIRDALNAERLEEDASAEKRRWKVRREEMRRTLREEGKHLPNDQA